MKKMLRKSLSAFLPIPLLLAMTLCCCLEENASAETISNSTEHHHELEQSHHAEHQDHDSADHECQCPKHLSFLTEQSTNILFDSAISQLLSKELVNLGPGNIIFLASLPNHSQGPPLKNFSNKVSIPTYLKVFNLRI